MRAFHNDNSIKNKYVGRVKLHQSADEIIKGIYWEGGKGCAVGCTLHSSNHGDYETELGIPMILAHLEDRIFENLPNHLAKNWPLDFLNSVNVGADLSKIWPKFAIFLLIDSSQCGAKHPQCLNIADCFTRELNGDAIDWDSVRKKAYVAATDVAAYAAYAAYAATDVAADAAAAYAAYAAHAAAYATEAAEAATDVAADAKQNAYIKQSEKLLELLKECI